MLKAAAALEPEYSSDDPESRAEGRTLAARAVRVRFAGVLALDAVDFDVLKGEILGLIGPNGAGKTTLLNVISGMQRPDEGRVVLDGRDVTAWSASRRARAGLGRTFQGARLFDRLSVFENIEVGASVNGGSRRESRQFADQLLRSLGLAEVSSRPARVLPHGMARRLGIARALSTRPAFLLLDEPAAGLDEEESLELVAMLRDVRETFGLGLVVIEHDVPLIMSLCERIHVLAHGKTLAIGSPRDVSRDRAVLDAYLGEALGEEIA